MTEFDLTRYGAGVFNRRGTIWSKRLDGKRLLLLFGERHTFPVTFPAGSQFARSVRQHFSRRLDCTKGQGGKSLTLGSSNFAARLLSYSAHLAPQAVTGWSNMAAVTETERAATEVSFQYIVTYAFPER
jgi:hypothetical protein